MLPDTKCVCMHTWEWHTGYIDKRASNAADAGCHPPEGTCPCKKFIKLYTSK